MRKIPILFLGLFLAFSSVAALAEITQPQLPVGLDKFVLADQLVFDCGVWDLLKYESENTLWITGVLNSNKNTNPLVLRKKTPNSDEIWVDHNMDGQFDEYFSTKEGLYKKYPTPCDAVK